MQPLKLFAGWPPCTSEQITQKSLALPLGVTLCVFLSAGMFFIFRFVIKSKLTKAGKIILSIMLALVTIPICVGIPLFVGFIMTPWCT